MTLCLDPRPTDWQPTIPDDNDDEKEESIETGIINPLTEMFMIWDENRDGLISADDIRLSFGSIDTD